MSLFTSSYKTANLLPINGKAYYFPSIMTLEEQTTHFYTLKAEIAWQKDRIFMFGKEIITEREVAWYGDEPSAYTYSGTTRQALPWTHALLLLKKLVERTTNRTYNSCLLNYYPNGNQGMGWHSDDEPEMHHQSGIASVSLGAERKFVFKHKKQPQKVELMLASGSLLLMEGATQTHWLHSLPKSRKIASPRINLTFRLLTK